MINKTLYILWRLPWSIYSNGIICDCLSRHGCQVILSNVPLRRTSSVAACATAKPSCMAAQLARRLLCGAHASKRLNWWSMYWDNEDHFYDDMSLWFKDSKVLAVFTKPWTLLVLASKLSDRVVKDLTPHHCGLFPKMSNFEVLISLLNVSSI